MITSKKTFYIDPLKSPFNLCHDKNNKSTEKLYFITYYDLVQIWHSRRKQPQVIERYNALVNPEATLV